MGRWKSGVNRVVMWNALSDGIELDLDIGDLSFVDVAGIELLKSLRGRGVNLLRVPPLVAGQLA